MSSEVEYFNSESLQFCKTIVIPILRLEHMLILSKAAF